MEQNEVHLSNKSVFKLVLGLILVLLVAGGGYLAYDKIFETKALLDVKIEPKETQFMPEEDVGFKLDLTNLGEAKRFDVMLTYRIIGSEGQILSTKQETLAVSTSMSLEREMALPSNVKLGRYQLKALVSYGKNQAASAAFSFEVVNEILKSGEITAEEQKFQDFLKRIEEVAKSSPSGAQQACEEQKNPGQHDECIRAIVKVSHLPEYCDSLLDDNLRDNCYLSFVMEGNTALCGKIKQENNKDYCNRLRDIDLLSKYYKSQS